MPVNGITTHKGDGYVVCYIETFSDELKALVREELNHICYGKNEVDEDTQNFYSYETTLREFIDRYSKKKTSTKKGMLGEFIAHLIIHRVLDNLQAVSLFFNKEEGSIKKGFDLTYVNLDGTEIWYGEVKSGELNATETADNKNKGLLGLAKRGMKENLKGERRTLWQSVMADAALTFASDEKIKVNELLKRDLQEIETNPATKKNAILVSVLFHDTQNRVSTEVIKRYLAKIKNGNTFEKVILFSVQKSTYQKIEEFLMSEIPT